MLVSFLFAGVLELRTAFEYTLAKAGRQLSTGRKKALSGEPDRALKAAYIS
jgi:hypothetical protein